jgi:hypothetical protein
MSTSPQEPAEPDNEPAGEPKAPTEHPEESSPETSEPTGAVPLGKAASDGPVDPDAASDRAN